MSKPDRLRQLIDAVLNEDHPTLGDMAAGAFATPFHFSRQVSQRAGEPPVAMRRRVLLERAAWQLRRGVSVTDSAFEAGYESVEGFSRAFSKAFGHVPSELPATQHHWLPAPNGIHFHPPMSLWVHTQEASMHVVFAQLVEHDLDDTRTLLELAKGIPDEDYRKVLLPGLTVTGWDGPEENPAQVLLRHVFTKEVWLAAILGEQMPELGGDSVAELLERHDALAPKWLETVRDLDRRQAWNDRIIDALCEPPESFVLSTIAGHVLTYAAHRRQLVRAMLRSSGHDAGDGDPINWSRERNAAAANEENAR